MENEEKTEAIKRKTEIIRDACFKHYDEFKSTFDELDQEDEYDAWLALVEQILYDIDRLHKYTKQFH